MPGRASGYTKLAPWIDNCLMATGSTSGQANSYNVTKGSLFTLGQTSNLSLACKKADIFKINGDDDEWDFNFA